jgi:hypothetical protein
MLSSAEKPALSAPKCQPGIPASETMPEKPAAMA